MVFQSHGELGGNLTKQAQILRLKRILARAAEDENSNRILGTEKRNTTQRLKAFRQKVPRNLRLKTDHLVFRENKRSALLHGAPSGTVMCANGQGRKKPLAQGEVLGLPDKKPGTWIVQLEASVFVTKRRRMRAEIWRKAWCRFQFEAK